MGSSTSMILSVKALLISTGVVSIAMFLKLSLPVIINETPIIWSSILSWLQPPYLYFVLNAIIIIIAASSKFHPKVDDSDQLQHLDLTKVPVPNSPQLDLYAQNEMYRKLETEDVIYRKFENTEEVEEPVEELKPVAEIKSEEDVAKKDDDEFVISRSTWTPTRKIEKEEFRFPVTEKPLVSSRFSNRKPVKASPEGGNRALRVAKPKRQETLESTWKAITDGRHVPLTRHLKKSDTFENHGSHATADSPTYSPRHVKKSETFQDRTNYNSPSPVSGGKLRKEASPSQDELNRRVEAFINKFNQEMRLQRQESLNQYMEMVNRGCH
ncbi:Cotton fiber expressed protein [Heracleum sosnowskyi]|uniref:Cotton fiber expressed protein n=1 Tax=Heracleum sosnowskyi TaxID=360622 RepID=A0AAD8MCI1_9APIA|nr:Cotton fiber expressed protein [Heracleum sosnowskyi]